MNLVKLLILVFYLALSNCLVCNLNRQCLPTVMFSQFEQVELGEQVELPSSIAISSFCHYTHLGGGLFLTSNTCVSWASKYNLSSISYSLFVTNIQLIVIFLILAFLVKKLIEMCIADNPTNSEEKLAKLRSIFKILMWIFSIALCLLISYFVGTAIVEKDLLADSGLEECIVYKTGWRVDTAIIKCESKLKGAEELEDSDISEESDYFYYYTSKSKVNKVEEENRTFFSLDLKSEKEILKYTVPKIKEDKNYFYVEQPAYFGNTGLPLFNSKDKKVVGILVSEHKEHLLFAKTYSYDFKRMVEEEEKEEL